VSSGRVSDAAVSSGRFSEAAVSSGRTSDAEEGGGGASGSADARGGGWRRMKENAVAAMAMQVGLTRGERRGFRVLRSWVKGVWGL